MNKKTLNDFVTAYDWLANDGVCDQDPAARDLAVGAWQRAKRPADIEAFIREQANAISVVIDKPCPNCGRCSPHNLTPTLTSQCRVCWTTWL